MIIIAVDFDNTLALGNCKINELKPNVELINRLRNTNAYIKIVTARGSKNNLTKAEKIGKYYSDIKIWLDKNSVPYNEISFNKEYAHLYIDDMTIGENDKWSNFESKFTKNNIILTDKSCIKKCKTSLNEFKWYKIANANNITTPKVLFCNDELIITENIKNSRKPTPLEVIDILYKFKNTPAINNADFKTYINNLSMYELNNVFEHSGTFYHGDLSTTNILVSDKVYLIDPNYKDIFGSYITDAGKAAFSFFAYENDIEAARLIWNTFPESKEYTITEGLRVCKYNKDYLKDVAELKNIFNV